MTEWIKCMVGYYLLVSVTMQMLPGKKYEAYVRLFTGFLLILFLLYPFLSIDSVEVYLKEQLAEMAEEQETMEKSIAGESKRIFEPVTEPADYQELIEIAPVYDIEVKIND